MQSGCRWVYTLLGKGTAAELKEKGLFGSEGTVHECYRKRGGVYKPGGVTRMEMELCQKRIRHPMKLPDQPAKVKRKPIGGVIDPSALAYDVHDLMIYNKQGPENWKAGADLWLLGGKRKARHTLNT